MDLEEWQKGINLAIDNALQLFKDGELLMKNGSYGHACFSFITAFEELGVALYILDHFNTPQPKELKKFLRHVKKLSLSSYRVTLYLTSDQNLLLEFLKLAEKQLTTQYNTPAEKKIEKNIREFGDKLRKLNSLWYIRNRGLYIELTQSLSAFQTPKEMHQGYATILFIIVSSVLPLIQAERDLYFKFGEDNKEHREQEAKFFQVMIKFMELLQILIKRSLDELRE